MRVKRGKTENKLMYIVAYTNDKYFTFASKMILHDCRCRLVKRGVNCVEFLAQLMFSSQWAIKQTQLIS